MYKGTKGKRCSFKVKLTSNFGRWIDDTDDGTGECIIAAVFIIVQLMIQCVFGAQRWHLYLFGKHTIQFTKHRSVFPLCLCFSMCNQTHIGFDKLYYSMHVNVITNINWAKRGKKECLTFRNCPFPCVYVYEQMSVCLCVWTKFPTFCSHTLLRNCRNTKAQNACKLLRVFAKILVKMWWILM